MKPGRLRIKAAQILNENGLSVTPDDILPTQGYWKRVDVYPWMVSTIDRGFLGCWQTLTNFVRNYSCGGKVEIGYGIDGEADIVCWLPD